MPKKGSRSKNKSKNRNLRLLKAPKFSKLHFIAFGLFFTVLGGFLLYKALAVTTTVKYSGTLTPYNPKSSFSLTTGTGRISATLKSRTRELNLKIKDSSGNIVSSASNTSSRSSKASADVESGTYTFEVSYAGSIENSKSFKLIINYPVADKSNPTAIITAPQDAESLSGTTTIAATATDDTGISKVEFYVDSELLSTDTTKPYSASWDTTKVANGSYTLSVKSYDTTNNTAKASVTAIVSNSVSTPNPKPIPEPTVTPTPTPSPTPSPSPTPTPVAGSCATSEVWNNLEACGWPGPSNTGPSGSLTLKPDGMTISESGTYTNLDVRKYLNINASNVTVKNFKLSDIVYGYTALRVDPGVINIVLEDCEINPNFVTQFAIWGYDNITVRRCEIYRNGGAIQARQNVVFEDNYCHDIDDVANDGDDWHTNCVIAVNDSRGVSNWRIYHNSMRLGTPGGLQYLSGVINTLLAANNTIENNLIANGAYSMYLFDTRSANVTPTNTVVKNNRLSTVDSPKVGIYGIWYPGQGWDSYKSAVTFSGNTVLETGKSVDGVEP